MAALYDYYKLLCKCTGKHSSSAGDNGGHYDYYDGNVVVENGAVTVFVGMRDLEGNEVRAYPVKVYNIDEEEIGYAESKAEYITVWNSNETNRAVGVLSSAAGPFAFKISLNKNEIAPPWVLGETDEEVINETEGIYGIEYATEYE